jgi:hypothetical protein
MMVILYTEYCVMLLVRKTRRPEKKKQHIILEVTEPVTPVLCDVNPAIN